MSQNECTAKVINAVCGLLDTQNPPINLSQFAEEMNIRPRRMEGYQRGDIPITLSMIQKMADSLGVDVSELTSGFTMNKREYTATVMERVDAILLGKEKPISMKELSALVDIHPTTLSRFRSGERVMDAHQLARIANAIGAEQELLTSGINV